MLGKAAGREICPTTEESDGGDYQGLFWWSPLSLWKVCFYLWKSPASASTLGSLGHVFCICWKTSAASLLHMGYPCFSASLAPASMYVQLCSRFPSAAEALA